MDRARAQRMTGELIGKEIGGWVISQPAGFGKSALVFKAKKGTTIGAVKIFDPELVERFGKDVQTQRIKRELELRNHGNPHLVKILDAGECAANGLLYVSMEFIDWPALEKVLSDIPRNYIWTIIGHIASAARFLESRKFVHRDIKPSNIVVAPDFSNLKLLDLGVIRPFGESDLTDEESRPFIGTLRYSPPELLYRREENSPDGWRAVTYYQLGGVLHDLIMRRPLFERFSEPYPELVRAVTEETPEIDAKDVEPELILLAKTCLSKEPSTRLRFVTWEHFEGKQQPAGQAISIKERLRRRRQEASLQVTSDDVLEENKRVRNNARMMAQLLTETESLVRQIARSSEFLPPGKFDFVSNPEGMTGQFMTTFGPSREYSLQISFTVYIEVKVINLEEGICELRSAVAARSTPALEDCSVRAEKIYEGLFEQATLKDRLDVLFHQALDTVLGLPAFSVNADQIHWISN